MTTFPAPGGATFMKAVNNLSDLGSVHDAQLNLNGIYGTALSSGGNLGETIQPRSSNLQDRQLTSGTAMLTYWRAGLTQTARWVITQSGGTIAAGLTVAQVGIYSAYAPGVLNIDQNGNEVLLASVSDTTMWTVAFTPYSRQLSAAVPIVAGNYYAVGVLAVGTTPPSLEGAGNFGFIAPYLGGQLSGQTALPASIPAASQSDAAFLIQAAVSAVAIQ